MRFLVSKWLCMFMDGFHVLSNDLQSTYLITLFQRIYDLIEKVSKKVYERFQSMIMKVFKERMMMKWWSYDYEVMDSWDKDNSPIESKYF